LPSSDVPGDISSVSCHQEVDLSVLVDAVGEELPDLLTKLIAAAALEMTGEAV
jgi:hypothetical protein